MNPRRNLQKRKARRKRNERLESRMSKIRGAAFSLAINSGRRISLGSTEWRQYMHNFAAGMYMNEYERLLDRVKNAE